MPQPQHGTNVFIQGLKQGNGKIVHIDWHDREVVVQLYDEAKTEVTLEWDQFERFNTRLNQWYIS